MSGPRHLFQDVYPLGAKIRAVRFGKQLPRRNSRICEVSLRVDMDERGFAAK